MRSPLFTEFKAGTALARTDAALTGQLLRHYKTAELLPAQRGLRRSTCVALAWNIQQARIVSPHPERLRGVISGARTANALAVWGDQERHWIVVTEGLMTVLRDAAESNAARMIAAFPAAFASPSGQRLLAATPLQGFQTMPGALLYFGAMSFVASHELGHHLAGHGAYYNAREKNCRDDGLHARWDVPHALERQADAIGVGAAILSINKLMQRFFTKALPTPAQRQEQQTLIAIVFTAGVLTSAARLMPAACDFAGAPSPNAYRVIRIAAMLMRPLRSLALLDEPARKRIRLTCLDIALGPRYKETAANDRPGARLRSMRQALRDPSFQAYMTQLDAGFRLFEKTVRAPL